MKKPVLISLVVFSILLVLGAGVFTLFKLGFIGQSILSVSNVNVGTDGKVYWTYYASASKPGETYTFSTSTPAPYNNGGTTVTPKTSFSLSITPQYPLCNYQLTSSTYNQNFLFGKQIPYYALNNPEKVANVDITNSNTGETKTLDGTTQTSTTFNSNGGTLAVETQGLLSGKFNCPAYSNDILIKTSNGYGIYKYSDFITYFSNAGNTNTISAFISRYSQDNAFTNTFQSFPILSSDSSTLSGPINLGFVTFTITADQNYFKSTYYTPPADAKPQITSISSPSQIQQGSQNSFTVYMSNIGSSGQVLITPTSNVVSISPSSINYNLGNSGSYSFNIVGQDSVGSGNINVQVCAVNQFAGNTNCVSKSVSIQVTEKPANTFCGDGICQANENKATCPSDCNNLGTGGSTLQCSKFQHIAPELKLGPFTFLSERCVLNSGWIVLIVLGVIIGIVLLIWGIIYFKNKLI